jgi:SWI/SNF-related matrix-associated actin-dependent regulator of chromatin subfamily A3
MFMPQIYRTAARLLGEMSTILSKLNSSSCSYAPGYIDLNVKRSGPQTILLVFEDGTELAALNDHICKSLDRLVDQGDIHIEALVHTLTLQERIGQITKLAEARFRVDIYLYGSQERSVEIGSKLSTYKVYLQRPDFQRPGSNYDNPQFLKFPGMKMPTQNHSFQSTAKDKLHRSSADRFQMDVSGLYASLKRSENLERRETDLRVTTILLP